MFNFEQWISWFVIFAPLGLSIAALIFVPSSSQNPKMHMRWKLLLIGFGVFFAVVAGLQQHLATRDSDRVQEGLYKQINGLSNQVGNSETQAQVDNAYLRAKLEDAEKMNERLSEFGPAIMKVAENAESFQKREYEAKMLSNKQTYDRVMESVKQLREFSRKYKILETNLEFAVVPPTLKTNAEQQAWYAQKQLQQIQLFEQKTYEWKTSVLPKALEARGLLLAKGLKGAEETSENELSISTVLAGSFAGIYPELAFADWLESTAKQLPQ